MHLDRHLEDTAVQDLLDPPVPAGADPGGVRVAMVDDAVIVQYLPQPVACTLVPGGDDDAPIARSERADVISQGIEDVDIAGGALCGERPPAAAADVNGGRAVRRNERADPDQRPVGKRAVPFVTVKVKTVRRQRLVYRCTAGGLIGAVQSCLVMIVDLFAPFIKCLADEPIEYDGRIRQVIEEAGNGALKQRQPVFHSRKTAPFANRLIETVFACYRAEQFAIPGPEPADRFVGQYDFACRNQFDRFQLPGRAL